MRNQRGSLSPWNTSWLSGSARAIPARLASSAGPSPRRMLTGRGADNRPVLDVRCDITDAEQVEAAFAQVEEAHGPVEVLVANAGITADTLVLRMSEDDWSSVIDTNLTGVFHTVRAALPALREGGRGGEHGALPRVHAAGAGGGRSGSGP